MTRNGEEAEEGESEKGEEIGKACGAGAEEKSREGEEREEEDAA